ncbi:uncharacterized protein L3040_005428 [Drepanopeziza brunnea f. sp. 'multigermtubi']|uniref:IgE-binding protein n=1 Tax=Marssonina brunnea f. sp. multigermtubi (strain MB_m1) TaxID=1072389 RepID=K1WM34_MARBU|nr:IgE-binding protein [Drepanopeziza brunnea f. sp. 'multigermtubi' MB_m1]EKD13961.1 IgE-binding protein [Drepanopeziza brunnea f. sp. 'multigermtubi' MB_m1]KAJ5040869.1 hypothetical protein L3040_005428 [Drepanopeziza brunnea f. sp. 'multigermtubi']
MVSLSNLVFGLSILATSAVAQFTLTVVHPDSPLDGLKVHASAQAFYLGLSGPSTYCPSVVEPYCPDKTDTVFAGMGGMWVNVPGGQQTYVRADGVFGYTQAHSAYVPEGAYRGGFVNVILSGDCIEDVAVYTWQDPDGSEDDAGILACPDVPYYMNGTATYQIYAKTPEFNLTNCVELGGLKPTAWPQNAGFGAWQYT